MAGVLLAVSICARYLLAALRWLRAASLASAGLSLQGEGTLSAVAQNDLAGIPPDRVGVLMVDFQNQFCHPRACGDGPVTNSHNAATAQRASSFAAAAARSGAKVIYTRQVLDPAQLTARQRRWDEQMGLC